MFHVRPASPFDIRGRTPWATLLFAAWASGACSPTATDTISALRIVPDVTSLHVGEVGAFSAVASYSSGATRATDGTWTILGSAVASEGAPSTVRGTAVGTARLRVAASGLFAERSLDVVEDLRGSWTGTLHYQTCNRLKGSGPGVCKNTYGLIQTLDLSFDSQSGREVPVVALQVASKRGVFSGRVEVTGDLTIGEGRAIWSDPEYGTDTMTFSDWQVRVGSSGGGSKEIVGTVTVDSQWTNAWGFQHYRDLCKVKLSRR